MQEKGLLCEQMWKETEIYIVDDDFLFNPKRLLEFCDLLEKNNIQKKYLVYGRADFIAENEPVIKRLKEVGLRAVIVGLESCDSKELVDYNKKTQVETNEKAVEILKKYDVECYGTFILGLDWKKEDFKALGNWIKKLGITFVNLQPLTPLRGTELYEQFKKDFIIKEEEYDRKTRTRHIKKIDKLFDVAVVDIPAYDSTSVLARNYFEAEREKEKYENNKLRLKLKLSLQEDLC